MFLFFGILLKFFNFSPSLIFSSYDYSIVDPVCAVNSFFFYGIEGTLCYIYKLFSLSHPVGHQENEN